MIYRHLFVWCTVAITVIKVELRTFKVMGHINLVMNKFMQKIWRYN